MLSRILIALDGSRRGETSLPWVETLFPKAEVTLIRAVGLIYSLDQYPRDILARHYKEAEDYLASRASSFKPPAKILVALGSPAPSILEEADRIRADLIALTTRGISKIFGSTAEQLIHRSEVPLLIVPPGKGEPPAKIRKILVPLDGSKSSAAILPLAGEMALAHGAELILVHVIETPQFGPLEEGATQLRIVGLLREVSDQHRKNQLAALQEYAGHLARSGVRARPCLAFGDAAAEVLAACKRESADLLILAGHGYGAFRRLFLGSVANRLIRQSIIPSLVASSQALSRLKLSPHSATKEVVT